MNWNVLFSDQVTQICVVGAGFRAGSEGSRGPSRRSSSGLAFVSLCVLFASPG